MSRTVLVAFGTFLASASLTLAQGLPEGTFASTQEGCAKLKEKSAAELGDTLDFTILNKTGVSANLQRCDFVSVTARNATSWLASAFCEEPSYSYPDLFAILKKENGDLSVTRLTMQQPSFDQSEEDPPLTADDLDPAEIGRSEGAGGDSQEPDEEVVPEPEAQKDHDPNTFFRCDNVKP